MIDNSETSLDIMSDVIVFDKYARYRPDLGRRETWDEICDRVEGMHIGKFPDLKSDIVEAFKFVRNKTILPAMRSLQFAGPAIIKGNQRMYNCSYMLIDSIDAFSEAMFLLLSGCGVGYSVQLKDVAKLPPLMGPNSDTIKYVVHDDIIGWAEAIRALFNSYTKHKPRIDYDFSDIRPKGTPLKTSGGKAPGPQPLSDALHAIRSILDMAIEERGANCRIKTIEAHDILCHIATAVLSGGIRRASCIAIFSQEDDDMMYCKSGNWWELNPQRQMANNSVAMHRKRTTEKQFKRLWDRVSSLKAGDPGFMWTNDDSMDMGYNPCFEASLRPNTFCNLVTINASKITNQYVYNVASSMASLISTIQASYTDFHYLRPVWKRNTEDDGLIGVSITGVANEAFLALDHTEAANHVVSTNEATSALIGINKAKRCTLIKPEGTSSLVCKTSSGIHAWYSEYYIRRITLQKGSNLYKYLKKVVPKLVEDSVRSPHLSAFLTIPVKAPDGAIISSEPALDLLERSIKFHKEWIANGHIEGVNQNNVSITCELKDDEWDIAGEWMWKNRHSYSGIAIIPKMTTEYPQLIFEAISKDRYEEMICHVKSIDITKVTEDVDTTSVKDTVACAGGACEIA